MLKIERDNSNFYVSFRQFRRLNTVISRTIEKQLLQLLETPATTLVFDLGGIQFIDSTGFDCLLKLEKKARENQCAFLLDNISPEVNELFHLMNLHGHFRLKGIDSPVKEKA